MDKIYKDMNREALMEALSCDIVDAMELDDLIDFAIDALMGLVRPYTDFTDEELVESYKEWFESE